MISLTVLGCCCFLLTWLCWSVPGGFSVGAGGGAQAGQKEAGGRVRGQAQQGTAACRRNLAKTNVLCHVSSHTPIHKPHPFLLVLFAQWVYDTTCSAPQIRTKPMCLCDFAQRHLRQGDSGCEKLNLPGVTVWRYVSPEIWSSYSYISPVDFWCWRTFIWI